MVCGDMRHSQLVSYFYHTTTLLPTEHTYTTQMFDHRYERSVNDD